MPAIGKRHLVFVSSYVLEFGIKSDRTDYLVELFKTKLTVAGIQILSKTFLNYIISKEHTAPLLNTVNRNVDLQITSSSTSTNTFSSKFNKLSSAANRSNHSWGVHFNKNESPADDKNRSLLIFFLIAIICNFLE